MIMEPDSDSLHADPPGRVLVVDDDDLVGTALSQSLSREGFRVDLATNVDEALALFNSGSIDVVLTDLIMPGGTGIDLLRHVETRDPMIPVIIITADDSVRAAAEAVRERAFDYLTKPVSRAELTEAVQRAVVTRRKSQIRRRERESLIRDHRRLEIQNKRRSALLSVLFNRAMEGIIIWDHRAMLVDASESFVTLVDEPLSKLLNRDIEHLFEPHPIDGPLRGRILALSNELDAPRQWRGDVTVRPNGRRRAHVPARLSLSVCEMPTEVGEADSHSYVVGLLSYDHEHAERSRQLQLADRLTRIGLMAGSAAHEIKNDLAPLVGYLSLTESEELHAREIMPLMREGVRRIRAHVEQILEPLRPRIRARGPVSLPDTIAGILSDLERAGRTRRTQVEVDTPSDDVLVHADKDELYQIAVNLILNALDALGDGGGAQRGTVQIRVSHAPPFGVLEVRDDGVGIAEPDRARVFEPFFTTKGQGGTGLGLPVVHDIVRSLRGRVSLTSVEHEGTSVRVQLPLSRASHESGAFVG
ncbi:MAG: response regulator [Myxococcales bacterium FL481]|nr:MAG: response regulator [Myxococcales bacterium FL481]